MGRPRLRLNGKKASAGAA